MIVVIMAVSCSHPQKIISNLKLLNRLDKYWTKLSDLTGQ